MPSGRSFSLGIMAKQSLRRSGKSVIEISLNGQSHMSKICYAARHGLHEFSEKMVIFGSVE